MSDPIGSLRDVIHETRMSPIHDGGSPTLDRVADPSKPESTTAFGRLWSRLWGAANREYEHPDLGQKVPGFVDVLGKALVPLSSAGALAIVFGSLRLTGGDFREASAVLLEIEIPRLIVLVVLSGSFFVVPAIALLIAVALGRSLTSWSLGWCVVRAVVLFGGAVALFVGWSCGFGSPVGFTLTIVAIVLDAFFFASWRLRESDTADGLEVILTAIACLVTLVVVSWAWPDFLPREVLEIACVDDGEEGEAAEASSDDGDGSLSGAVGGTGEAKSCPETVRDAVVLDEGGDWFSYWHKNTVVHVAPDRVVSRN